MRSVLLFVSLLAAPACSLLVDTSGLTGGPADSSGERPDGGVGDAAVELAAVEAGTREAAAASPDAAIPTCGTLASGSELHVEDNIESCNGKFTLVFQGDGNIVLYGHKNGGGGALWATETYDAPVDHAVMQADGDFVVVSGNGKHLWSTNTGSFPGAYLSVTDDGFVTVTSGGEVRWRSMNY